jgi:penicillin-binding protein 2
VIIWVVLVGRVYYITMLRGEHYGILALRNTIKEEPIIPVRGAIYDKNGVPLAVNRLGFSISLQAHLSRAEGGQLDQAISYLLEVTKNGLPSDTNESLRARYIKLDNSYSHDPVELIPFMPYETALPYFTRLSLNPIINISPTTLRHYPHGTIASHILGYVSKVDRKNKMIDPISRTIGYYGRAGLEVFYNKELQGELGLRKFQVTALNREIDEISRVEPSQNQDITLFLDIRLQQFVHEIYMGEGKSGAILVMDLETGGILAAGSFPEYDHEKFITGIGVEEWQAMANDFSHPFVNKLVNSLYPPGSIIKPAISLAFLEAGEITPHTDFLCEGSITIGDRQFRCWRKYGHGRMDMRRAIAESCDTYFYKGATATGIDRISRKLVSHNFGGKTGVDLPNEFVGIVPSRERKVQRLKQPWTFGDTINTSIGQGDFLVTPMQMLQNAALLATGKLIAPRFARIVKTRETQFDRREVFTESDRAHIKLVRDGIGDAAGRPGGTSARAMDVLPFKIAGKTGTAQVAGIPQDEKVRMSESQLEFNMRSHAWYIGYAPLDKPRYAFATLIEHGMSGGGHAAPLTARVLRKMDELGYFEGVTKKERSIYAAPAAAPSARPSAPPEEEELTD